MMKSRKQKIFKKKIRIFHLEAYFSINGINYESFKPFKVFS